MDEDCYRALSEHLSRLAVGPAHNEWLVQILRESLSEEEARVLLCLPTGVGPFEPVLPDDLTLPSGMPAYEVESTLQRLSGRGLVFRGRTRDGREGYALHQFGYGMPQTFFWPNEDTPFARRMADLCMRHSSAETLTKAFGGAGTKVYRWVPIHRSIEPVRQAVLPYARIEEIIGRTTLIASVNCNCRVMSRIKGRSPCRYPLDVCMKYDDLAEYLITIGIGRKVSRDEAMALNRKAEEAGCVHFADNVVEGEIRHACNCCPCCCWALGNTKRRRIRRDLLMACQFIRETDLANCAGCGQCADACPVSAVAMKDGLPEVDRDWCIGCGVCTMSCPSEAIRMVRREDVPEPLEDFKRLSEERLANKDTSSNGRQ